MAEDLTREQQAALPAASPVPLVQSPRRAEEPTQYRFRFGLAYLALAMIAGAGIGAAVLLLGRTDTDTSVAWSNWKPSGRESTYPTQIADYVSDRYRLPSGNPLVGILAGPPEVQDVAVRAVAIQNDPEGDTDDISIVPTDESVMYVLCGLGERCSIREGSPSEARHRLLRREALELALYTFRYGSADSVIALLPPRPPQQGENEEVPSTALFFQRKDFKRELDRPLRQTLLSAEPRGVAEISSLEGSTIDRLTTPHLFSYEFQQAQEGSAIIILLPVSSGN